MAVVVVVGLVGIVPRVVLAAITRATLTPAVERVEPMAQVAPRAAGVGALGSMSRHCTKKCTARIVAAMLAGLELKGQVHRVVVGPVACITLVPVTTVVVGQVENLAPRLALVYTEVALGQV
jgi:hypothetical protein